jgi:hypothetical protein
LYVAPAQATAFNQALTGQLMAKWWRRRQTARSLYIQSLHAHNIGWLPDSAGRRME